MAMVEEWLKNIPAPDHEPTEAGSVVDQGGPSSESSSAQTASKRRRTGSAVGTIAGGENDTPRMQPQGQPISRSQPEPAQVSQPSQPSPMAHPPMAPIRRQPQHMPMQQQQYQQIPEDLPGSRPTRIMGGCWTKSSAAEDSEKRLAR